MYLQNISTKLPVTLLTILIIAACGGGGGGGSSDPPPPPPPPLQGVTLSGGLSVPTYVVTDSDVNDTQTTPVPNHPIASAQQVQNPANIGGYVNVAGAGSPGNSYASGDPSDYYLIDMTAGQTLLLNIADHDATDPTAVDLDLGLYNAQFDLIDASVGVTQIESLVVPEDGQYYVRVDAYSGASNYLLSVGLTPASELSPRRLWLSDPFVPGDVLVRFKDQTTQARELDPAFTQFEFVKFPGKTGGGQLLNPIVA